MIDGYRAIKIEELLTLVSIYYDIADVDCQLLKGSIRIPLPLDAPIKLRLRSQDGITRETEIGHLPPLIFNFELPERYPFHENPTVEFICDFIDPDRLQSLTQSMVAKWEDAKDVILFAMVSALIEQSNDGIFQPSHIDCISSSKYDYYGQYDQDQRTRKFNASTFGCEICQAEFKGIRCSRFQACGHVYCNDCLLQYFTSLIEGGYVEKVHCPNPECTKQELESRDSLIKSTASESFDFEFFRRKLLTPAVSLSLLLTILNDSDLQSRYLKMFQDHQLALIAKLFPMRLVACPRQGCPSMIFRENMTSRLVICRVCDYAFCNTCRKSFHSDSIDCAKKAAHLRYQGIPIEALEAWVTLEKDSTARREIRLRYGHELLTQMAHEYTMDRLFEELTADEALDFSKCPTCDMIIQRSEGCNKMRCTSCLTSFCYLCGDCLDYNNPYDHYNESFNRCYGKLFQGMPGV